MAYNNIRVGKLSPGERFFWDGNYYMVINRDSRYVNSDELLGIHANAELVINVNDFRLRAFHPDVMVQPIDAPDYDYDTDPENYVPDHHDLGGK